MVRLHPNFQSEMFRPYTTPATSGVTAWLGVLFTLSLSMLFNMPQYATYVYVCMYVCMYVCVFVTYKEQTSSTEKSSNGLCPSDHISYITIP